jgi:hypothetical protein
VEAEERNRIFQSMDKMLHEREHIYGKLNQYLKDFSTRLFAALESVLGEAEGNGIPGVGKTRRIVHPAGAGREGLQVYIEDWSIIFVPLLGFARPNAQDEARIPPIQFKLPCARIAVFLTDDPQGHAFYDFIIFEDQSWFAWGYGWPKQQSDIESTDFEGLALELLHSFVKDIFITWTPRGDTMLATAMHSKNRAYSFGLPGEDRPAGT